MVRKVFSTQPMCVVFRVDASTEIGTGHVMRCLTLADALTRVGADCHFICRNHIGNMNDYIRQRGYPVYELTSSDATPVDASKAELQHEHWLQVPWADDAAQSYDVMQRERICADWLVLDHYALDARWQRAMKPTFERLMVIDDLADREHVADLLLDQNLGRAAADYDGLVPESCIRLIGPQYAMLRPEFAQWRSYSLKRRQNPELKHILVTMGGVDKDNFTGRVLDALARMDPPSDMRIHVVLGERAPSLKQVRQQAKAMAHMSVSIHVNVENMAQMMSESDLVIGAAGSTSWERCCLGVPSVLMAVADNQRKVCDELSAQKAALTICNAKAVETELLYVLSRIMRNRSILFTLSDRSKRITSGNGTEQVVEQLKRIYKGPIKYE